MRETSRKPDEMYTLLERLSPGTRKIEIFARPNNLGKAHGWIGLGNQLNGCRILVGLGCSRGVSRQKNFLGVGVGVESTLTAPWGMVGEGWSWATGVGACGVWCSQLTAATY